MKPTISMIMRSYNREDTISRAINSVLAQDFKDWELIVVEDASTDNSLNVISSYKDPRIRIIIHEKNRGNAAALNTGLDNIKGDWFTLLDNDDELITPYALTTLLEVPKRIDTSINAITCNCIDSSTGKFSGFGLDQDQYLDAIKIFKKCSGEFYGLTKTSLLQGDRLNDSIPGMEGFLWYGINKRANRYYIHKALRIWHTEGENRFLNLDFGNKIAYKRSIAIMDEKDYLDDNKKYGMKSYLALMYTSAMIFITHGDKKRAFQVFKKIVTLRKGLLKSILILGGISFGKGFYIWLGKIKTSFKF